MFTFCSTWICLMLSGNDEFKCDTDGDYGEPNRDMYTCHDWLDDTQMYTKCDVYWRRQRRPVTLCCLNEKQQWYLDTNLTELIFKRCYQDIKKKQDVFKVGLTILLGHQMFIKPHCVYILLLPSERLSIKKFGFSCQAFGMCISLCHCFALVYFPFWKSSPAAGDE